MKDEIHDFDSELEPPQPEEDPSPGVPWGGIVGTFGVVLLVVFAVQNTENVIVEFLWLTGDFPLSIVILVTAVAAVVLALLSGSFFRRRRRARRGETRVATTEE